MKGKVVARYLQAHWAPGSETSLPRRDRRSGSYRRYVPDLLAERPLRLPVEVSRRSAALERAVRDLGGTPTSPSLESISRFLLRSEAIASSKIEGIAPSPGQVALAELADDEPVRGFSDQARLVANNMTVLRHSTRELAIRDTVAVSDVEALHGALLPNDPDPGLRTVQNWIGGSNWHPLDADFVPAPPELVPGLMEDLTTYLDSAAHGPLIQAALLHAQFETIHPFTDGNGRVGRALVHTVLTRRGLTPSAILPVSLVLATVRDSYVGGLGRYRYLGGPGGQAAQEGVAAWVTVFLDAAEVAVVQAQRLTTELEELGASWSRRVERARADGGVRAVPRAGSATARLLPLLPELPLVTTRTVERVLGVSFPAARAAVEELAVAQVLSRRQVERNTTGYLATEVLELLGSAERRLASTRWDTRLSPPNRPVPAAGQSPRRPGARGRPDGAGG